MEDGILFGLMAIGLGSACFAVGFTVKLQMHALQLQTEMLKYLGDLTRVIIQQSNIQTMPMPDWRDLPPDARLMMRESLIEVLREMDAEIPARH